MAAKIIDGKQLSKTCRAQVAAAVTELTQSGARRPGLAVVQLGEDPASSVYVRNKGRACDEVGFLSRTIKLSDQTTQAELFEQIDQLNADPEIDGILVQLPIPDCIDEHAVIERIDPAKDVDGFHPYNVGLLTLKMPVLRSCTPKGVMTMLASTGINLEGLNAVVLGQSNIVGRPMALELLMSRCTVTICHSRTRDLEGHIGNADLLVAAVGRPNFVQGEWIKPGAIVIDVGINRLDDGSLCGDVDYNSALERASWITPVPGGVGPMTIASLLENTLIAYQQTLKN